MHVTQPVLDALVRGGALAPTGDDPPALLPARDLRTLNVAELLALVRSAGEERFLTPQSLPAAQAVEEALERYERAIQSALGDTDVASLADPPREREVRDPE
jgi:membrane protein